MDAKVTAAAIARRSGYSTHVGCGGQAMRAPREHLYHCQSCGSVELHAGPDVVTWTQAEGILLDWAVVTLLGEP